MNTYYTSERNTQILIALLKAHGIRRIIASPGSTNICLVASLQHDPYFEIYSSVDERSAAYMACGMVAESGEPVALSCTGATASRNYVPALTEAFYRKLPVLAITSSHQNSHIGHNIPQVTDRRSPMPDIAKLSVQLPIVHDEEDVWECEVKINQALLELKRHGGGPVHINLPTLYSQDYSVQTLPSVRVIYRYTEQDTFPDFPEKEAAILVGAHLVWSERLTKAVDRFCERYNGVVLCDLTSNYNGKYGVQANLVAIQQQYRATCTSPKIMIHIGDISGAYMKLNPKQVWRVNPDGEIRDTFKKLTNVFEMEEITFFERYANQAVEDNPCHKYYDEWQHEYQLISEKVPDIPFSSVWIAQQTAPLLPVGSALHLGILNSLRTWNYFRAAESVRGYSNVGGFGIDGCVSSLLGASLVNPQTLFFGVVGDLAFFYDMNSLGNRHIGRNLRIMLVNNGVGFEMKYYKCVAPIEAYFGDRADEFIAAKGHFGKMSRNLVKHYAEDLGFAYLTASNKEEYLEVLPSFIQPNLTEKPILLEVFTDEKQENDAQKSVDNLGVSFTGAAKQIAKNILGPKGVESVKKIIKG